MTTLGFFGYVSALMIWRASDNANLMILQVVLQDVSFFFVCGSSALTVLLYSTDSDSSAYKSSENMNDVDQLKRVQTDPIQEFMENKEQMKQ